MTTIKLKYLTRKRDRLRIERVYVRKGKRWITLREKADTEAFFAEYQAALRQLDNSVGLKTGFVQRPQAGTLRWLCSRYYTSGEFSQLKARTQKVRRQILERLCQGDGGRDGSRTFAGLRPKHVRQIRDEMADRPEAANGMVKALRQAFKWAIEAEEAHYNPANEVPYLDGSADGWHKWTLEEVEQYKDRHASGTKARLALELLLLTGVRRSDVVKLGKQMARNGKLRFRETKNEDNNPKDRDIPILPELQAEIDACQASGTITGNMTYLVTEFDRPFTADGFGNKFRDWCNQAGLPKCSAHGLRKAGATIAANNSATAHELMAIFGWTTLKEAERYTRDADRTRLAEGAMHKLIANKG